MTDFACTSYAPTSSHLPRDRKTHFAVMLLNPDETNGYVIHNSEEITGDEDKEGKK
jgi:hypothetical protein